MNTKVSAKIWYVGGGAMLLVALGLIVWRVLASHADNNNIKSKSTESLAQPKLEATISGQVVSPEVAERRPMAVMVENHPDARPHSGLSKAEVVYEMVAEGGITRFVAVFQQDVSSIGPVRSARDYFAEIADSWHAVYAHVGGSPEALDNIKKGVYKNLTDINEFYQGSYFTRSKSRPQPHNTYISTEKLLEFIALKDAAREPVQPFVFSDSPTVTTAPATEIALNFSTGSYQAKFGYDPVTRTYPRTIGGLLDKDVLTKQQLAPKTIIVQLTDIDPIPGDEKLRVNIRTTGNGKAYVFQNGGVIEGAWERKASEPTKYFDANHKEVTFLPGQIWVAFLPQDSPNALEYK